MLVSFNAVSFMQKNKTNIQNQTNPGLTPRVRNVGPTQDVFQKSNVSFTGVEKASEAVATKVEGMVKEIVAKKFYKITDLSPLERARAKYKAKLPSVLKGEHKIVRGPAALPAKDQAEIQSHFPKTYGQPTLTFEQIAKSDGVVNEPALTKLQSLGDASEIKKTPHKVAIVLSGGPAPGANAIIHALIKENPESEFYGFLGGADGLLKGNYVKLTLDRVEPYKNLGGFDLTVSGRGKIETDKHFAQVLANCKKLGIDVITNIGGDDTGTNSAHLAEKFFDEGINVIGCPKTIDGDLKNAFIETSFGFDTATKSAASFVGDLAKDRRSTRKYYDIVQLMGRDASNLTAEVALQTHPNITLISEEVAKKNMSLDDVVTNMANIVIKRFEIGKNHGVAVVPEGLLGFIPEIGSLIKKLDVIIPEINKKMDSSKLTAGKTLNADEVMRNKIKLATKMLNKKDAKLYSSLPEKIRGQFLLERDKHGNFPYSKVNTGELLGDLLKSKLAKMKDAGTYKGDFEAINHSYGYDLRAVMPTNFDVDYCNTLGHVVSALMNSGKTGYMASVKNLTAKASDWKPCATPISAMMNMEIRGGVAKPVIEKTLTSLDGPVFKELIKHRQNWELHDKYQCVGAIQYFGPSSITDTKTKTLILEQGGKIS